MTEQQPMIFYEPGQMCGYCRSRAWYVGRFTAECGRCGNPFSLPTGTVGAFTVRKGQE